MFFFSDTICWNTLNIYFRALGAMLDDDRETYKRPDLSNIRRAVPSIFQTELASLASTGTFNGQLDDGAGEESDHEQESAT